MTSIIFNGNLVPSNQAYIRHNDRGFTLGHGIFETILCKKGAMPLLRYHWQRFASSAPLIGIKIPFSFQELESMIIELVHQNKVQDKRAAIRLTLTCGESERGILPAKTIKPTFVITASEYHPMTVESFSACIVSTRKNEQALSSKIKSTSYLDNFLAKQEAVNRGYDEAFLLNTVSKVADGAITNIFIIREENIYTPPITDGALPGVMRNYLLEQFSKEFHISEHSFNLKELMRASEIFVTNSLMGIKNITQLNEKKLNIFDKTNQLRQAFNKTIDYI